MCKSIGSAAGLVAETVSVVEVPVSVLRSGAPLVIVGLHDRGIGQIEHRHGVRGERGAEAGAADVERAREVRKRGVAIGGSALSGIRASPYCQVWAWIDGWNPLKTNWPVKAIAGPLLMTNRSRCPLGSSAA